MTSGFFVGVMVKEWSAAAMGLRFAGLLLSCCCISQDAGC